MNICIIWEVKQNILACVLQDLWLDLIWADGVVGILWDIWAGYYYFERWVGKLNFLGLALNAHTFFGNLLIGLLTLNLNFHLRLVWISLNLRSTLLPIIRWVLGRWIVLLELIFLLGLRISSDTTPWGHTIGIWFWPPPHFFLRRSWLCSMIISSPCSSLEAFVALRQTIFSLNLVKINHRIAGMLHLEVPGWIVHKRAFANSLQMPHPLDQHCDVEILFDLFLPSREHVIKLATSRTPTKQVQPMVWANTNNSLIPYFR